MELKYKLAIDLIKHFEGFSATAYTCPAGIPTIGYGRTTGSMKPTTRQAEEKWLLQKLILINRDINVYVKPYLNANQMAALMSFIYNVGIGAFISSTLLKKINNESPLAAASEILRWDKVNGKTLAGLTRRRLAEYKLYVG